MALRKEAARMIHLPRERMEEAADVMALAFAGYPMMEYLFAGADAPMQDCMRAMFRLTAQLRYLRGWPVLALEHQGQVIGVALVAQPHPPAWNETMSRAFDSFKAIVGPSAAKRLEAYSAVTDAPLPKEPPCYLAAIGVHPKHKGQGHGRTLLDAVHALSQAHPTSTGVAWSTETPVNAPLYEHVGYPRAGASEAGVGGRVGDVPAECVKEPWTFTQPLWTHHTL